MFLLVSPLGALPEYPCAWNIDAYHCAVLFCIFQEPFFFPQRWLLVDCLGYDRGRFGRMIAFCGNSPLGLVDASFMSYSGFNSY